MEGLPVTMRHPKTSLFYATGTPVRWLRTAAAMLDESLATLCARQWRTQLAPIRTPSTPHLRKRLR